MSVPAPAYCHSVDDYMHAVRQAIHALPRSDVVVLTDTSFTGRTVAGIVTGIRCFVPIALSYGVTFDGRRPPILATATAVPRRLLARALADLLPRAARRFGRPAPPGRRWLLAVRGGEVRFGAVAVADPRLN